jgi:predicted Rossmann fold nucleotide-binding protein DprA/Smf involved in DNA uptake
MRLGRNARHFPRHNRIVGCLAQPVIVVEPIAKSSNLITARNAADVLEFIATQPPRYSRGPLVGKTVSHS